ncbi:TetR family transcriptional regulator C-terminal domain-containing protein [Sulfitobacter sp.]|uniref:TetR family transcriptional regulator C-terminal domain-containing protein n=1 Tax=Sulfitobacter sp. TaxID=1903071 RepID=UPI003002669F
MPIFPASAETLVTDATDKKPSRIQMRNRRLILDAALDVFSRDGYGGSTLDAIANGAGLSKPNLLYYFDGKKEIYVTLLSQLLETWLDPLIELDPEGDPVEELLSYVRHKLDMALEMPAESKLFAGEMLQGAPRMADHLNNELKPLFDRKCQIIQDWIDAGRLAPVDPPHLIFSIWSSTQHYADFGAQVAALLDAKDPAQGAHAHLEQMFRRLLQPAPV